MRIAILTNDFPPNIGGLASHVVELAQELRRQDHNVQVWGYLQSGEPLSEPPGLPVCELGRPERAGNAWSAARHYARVIRERIDAFSPDIIHCHTMAPLSLAMRWLPSQNYRRIFTNHTSGYLKLIQTWRGRWKAKIFCSWFDGLLAPSVELREKSSLLWIPRDRQRYISNAVDAEVFRPGDQAAARTRLKLPLDRRILLSTRRFVPKNGVRYLAEALPQVVKTAPDVLCVFCGNDVGPEEQAVREIIDTKGLANHVRFEGSVPNSEIPTYLHASDLVVLPSLMEATSISGLEAMSCGKPLVGTRVGGIPYIIEEGVTGRLVEPGDAGSLAAAVVDVLGDPSFERFGVSARERIEREFTWPVITEKTVGFYRSMLEKPPIRRLFDGR